jgi:hypothetical protein
MIEIDVKELIGLPPDPNCLHCYLFAVIEQWMQQHPHKPAEHVLIEIAHTLGEIVGASAPEPGCVDGLVAGLARYTIQIAKEIAGCAGATPPAPEQLPLRRSTPS